MSKKLEDEGGKFAWRAKKKKKREKGRNQKWNTEGKAYVGELARRTKAPNKAGGLGGTKVEEPQGL